MANKKLKSILVMGTLSAVDEAYPEFRDYYKCKKKEEKHHL